MVRMIKKYIFILYIVNKKIKEKILKNYKSCLICNATINFCNSTKNLDNFVYNSLNTA